MHELAHLETEMEVLITVKAYPKPSHTYGESVCVAGIRIDAPRPTWIRLYPLNFRSLPIHQQFEKWDVIRVRARRRSEKDPRPESYSPILDSIEIIRHIDTKHGWRYRKPYVEALQVASMCELKCLQKENGTSLGFFKPGEILDIVVSNAKELDEERRALALRQTLFGPKPPKPLEWLPYEFKFRYRCDDPGCNTHTMGLIDWELGQFYRNTQGKSEEERMRAVEERWLHTVCGPDRDPHFFAGNLQKRQHVFMLLGVFWPPKVSADQLALSF